MNNKELMKKLYIAKSQLLLNQRKNNEEKIIFWQQKVLELETEIADTSID